MSYQVLARKWRPRVFADVVGQEHALRALRNALEQERLHHAYLFTGTRGVGKTTLARIVAKCLCCVRGISAEPCGTCGPCRDIDAGRYPDLIEVDAASRARVEETRELMENVPYAPTAGRRKVYLIDEVHMFSGHSFNALLKTLEEPPEHVQFLFATTEPKRLPITILSRCLHLHLRRLETDRITARLRHVAEQEQVEADQESLELLARAADGSLRDALSLLDRAISDGGGGLRAEQVRAMLGTVESGLLESLLEAIRGRDGPALLESLEAIAALTPDYSLLLAELLSLLQRVALVQAAGGKPAAAWENACRWAERLPAEEVQLLYEIALHGRRDLEYAPDPRTGFEMCMVRMLDFYPARETTAAPDGAPRAPGRAAPPPAREAPLPPPAAAPPTSKAVPPPPPPTTAPPDRATAAAPGNALEQWWLDLLPQLQLRGFAGQVARNCLPSDRGEAGLTLALAPAHANLLGGEAGDKIREELCRALKQHLGGQFTLRIVVRDGGQGETAAKRNLRQQRERREEARRLLREDENVRRMGELFDARLDPDSVTPDPPGTETS